MKKYCVTLICLLLVVALCGCASRNVRHLSLEGYTLSVDTEECTVTWENDVYRYEQVVWSILKTEITVFYPNGASYTQIRTSPGVVIVAPGADSSQDYAEESQVEGAYTGTVDESRYVPGAVLAQAVYKADRMAQEQKEKDQDRGIALFAGVFLLILGILELCFPKALWHLRHWMSVSGGEPTEFYMISAAISGWILVAAGVIFLLIGIF